MHAAAGRGSRLVFAGEPLDLFARAVAFYGKFGAAHVRELDLDRIA